MNNNGVRVSSSLVECEPHTNLSPEGQCETNVLQCAETKIKIKIKQNAPGATFRASSNLILSEDRRRYRVRDVNKTVVSVGGFQAPGQISGACFLDQSVK